MTETSHTIIPAPEPNAHTRLAPVQPSVLGCPAALITCTAMNSSKSDGALRMMAKEH